MYCVRVSLRTVIPCATLKGRGSWAISIYLCLELKWVDCVDLSDSDGEEGEISRDSNEIFLLLSVESKTIKTGYVALVAEIQVWYFLMLSTAPF
jgi:hypothetical protein